MGPPLSSQGKPLTEGAKKVELLNRYFLSVFRNELSHNQSANKVYLGKKGDKPSDKITK